MPQLVQQRFGYTATWAGLVAAPAGKGLSALTDYVDVSGGKAANPVMGLWNPDTYCQADPTLVSCNLQRGDQTGGLGLFSFQGVSGTSATAPGGPYKQLSKVGDQGAELAFTYQGERLEGSVRKLAESIGSTVVVDCDAISETDTTGS